MKLQIITTTFITLCVTVMAQTNETNSPGMHKTPKLQSTIFDWEKLKVTPTTNGVRRDVLDGPTATLDKLHCHITTLNPGQTSGEPRLHLQEEVIIVREGSVEATVDGRVQTVGPGSVIFFGGNAGTRLRNAGSGPATYTVVH